MAILSTKASITLVIASLIKGGGAERVMSLMANHWAAKGHPVSVVTFYRDDREYYELHPNVKLTVLGLIQGSGGWLSRVQKRMGRLRQIRNAVMANHPDAVISFMDRTNLLTLLALKKTKVPVIVSERTDPRQHRQSIGLRLARRLLYRRAAAVVVQTSALRKWAAALTSAEKVFVIPNPVEAFAGYGTAEKAGARRPFVLAMGRLIPLKRFDLLIRVFSVAGRSFPEWSLVILGDGEERQRLTGLADELGVAERVSLPGQVADASGYLQECDLFVLSSDVEGFPNSLLEAMAAGNAVISTDCPSGPREIIEPEVDGILVPCSDEEAMSKALLRLMGSPELRRNLGGQALRVVERFDIEVVMNVWEDAISRATMKALN